jgi:transcriptional regulator with XRE-family HTH domain
VIFDRKGWQRDCRKMMQSHGLSYRDLALRVRIKYPTLWRILRQPKSEIDIEEYLLISRILELDPLDYITKDEVQLKLL